jgi:hypothetical protein
MSVIRIGSPAVPVKITETGTCLAKLEHIWQAARRYAKRRGYRVIKTYGESVSPRFRNSPSPRGSDTCRYRLVIRFTSARYLIINSRGRWSGRAVRKTKI